MKDLVTYFNHMKRVIFGTAFIDNKQKRTMSYSTGGKKLQSSKVCSNCNTSYCTTNAKKDKTKICPFCHAENV